MYDFSQVRVADFLGDVIDLFNLTLTSSYNEPALRFFMAAALFFVAVSLLARMIRQGRRGRR